MPILQIEVVGKAADYPADLAQQLADSCATELRSRPQGTWVKLLFIPRSHYAENGGAPEQARPILVSLLQAQPPSGTARRELVAALARSIAQVTGHEVANVHIVLEPPAVGRIALAGYWWSKGWKNRSESGSTRRVWF